MSEWVDTRSRSTDIGRVSPVATLDRPRRACQARDVGGRARALVPRRSRARGHLGGYLPTKQSTNDGLYRILDIPVLSAPFEKLLFLGGHSDLVV